MTVDFVSSALIEIDVQNDFCPGGALAVGRGDEVVEPLNRLAARFAAGGGRVIATQDWHPANHVSFAASHDGKNAGDAVDLPGVKGQILWPVHCVRNREGAAFHRGLDLAPVNLVLRKGFRENLDSYSAFFENDRATPTGVVSDAVRGVGFPEGSVERAFKRLEEAGVIIAGSGEIL